MPSIRSVSLIALSLVVYSTSTPLSTSPFIHERSPFSLAPLRVSEYEAPHGIVNNSYIVMLKKDTPRAAVDNHFNFLQAAHAGDPLQSDDSGITNVYDGHVKGYSGFFTEGVVQQIRSMPEVDYIERDQIVRTQNIQLDAPWGLARISHRKRLGFSTFTKYLYEKHGGDGVDVYIVDTGVNIKHEEFEGRAIWGKTIPRNDLDEDMNGHGTHCAGTIASKSFGVAKNANIIAVKVLGSNGSGTMGDVVAGVVFVADAATKKMEEAKAEFKAYGQTRHKGSVANMSLGGGKSQALNDAVNAAVDAGVHFAVAAGNDNRDACSYSPGSAERAVTVGASTIGDDRASFSNYGTCVDVFAPGLNIRSTYIGSTTATTTLSGTSMASPHTAGLLAYLLSIYPSTTFNPGFSESIFAEYNLQLPFSGSLSGLYEMAYGMMPRWISTFIPPPRLIKVFGGSEAEFMPMTPDNLKEALLSLATSGMLTDLPKGTPNLLIFNNATAS